MISGRFFGEVFYKEIYKPVRELGNDLTVIDLGACTGEFSLWVYPQAKQVYAIEADKEAYDHLFENIEEFPKITSFNLAIAGEGGKMVSVFGSGIGSKTIMDWNGKGSSEQTVPALTLYAFLRNHAIEKVDCLKIDVESAEKQIYEAEDFPEAAERVKYIIGEPHNDYEAIKTVLEKNGYKVEQYQNGYIARR